MDKLVTITIIIGPILYSYFFPGTTIHIDTLLMLGVGVLTFAYNIIYRKRINASKSFYFYLVYALIVPFIGLWLYDDFSPLLSSYITLITFSFIYIQGTPHINWRLLIKVYRILVYFSCGLFVIQEIMYAILGWRIAGLVPFLHVAYSYTDTASMIARHIIFNRSSSIFLEPAHFAQFVAGYIAIRLGEKSNIGSINVTEPLILSVILIFTWSGNCVLALALIWSLYLIFVKINKLLKFAIIVPISIVIALNVVDYVANTDKGEALMKRQSEMNLHQSRVSSGMMRIYRGYYVYETMPEELKITGVGTGYIPDVIDESPVSYMFESFERYVNNIQTLLIGNGIIGTFLFGLFLFGLVFRRNRICMFLALLFLAFSFIENFWCTSKMLLFISIASASLRLKSLN